MMAQNRNHAHLWNEGAPVAYGKDALTRYQNYATAIQCGAMHDLSEIMPSRYGLKERIGLDHDLWLKLTDWYQVPSPEIAHFNVMKQVEHIIRHLKRQMAETVPNRQDWHIPLNLYYQSKTYNGISLSMVRVYRHTYKDGMSILWVVEA